MLDTITYIPTILAYTFVTLLVVILCFIIIYVSHKVYATVYDNLPALRTESVGGSWRSLMAGKDRMKLPKSPTEHQAEENLPSPVRKSKTALTIIVVLEPCYLAYVVFETGIMDPPSNHISSYNNEKPYTMTMQQLELAKEIEQQLRPNESTYADELDTSKSMLMWNHNQFIKYFDHLSSIPIVEQCNEKHIRLK